MSDTRPSIARALVFTLLAFGLPALPVQAQQARSQDDSYVALELLLGVGGEADVEIDVLGATGSGDTDLEASFGGALSWMHPLHRYFVLGVQFGALSWKPENVDDRNLLTDLLLVPQGRFPASDDLELTVSLPVGMVVDFWGGDEVDAAVVMADLSPAFGWELGLLLGVRYAVSPSVGLLARLGYVAHGFTHEAEIDTLIGSGTQDLDFSLGQPRLQLGVSF